MRVGVVHARASAEDRVPLMEVVSRFNVVESGVPDGQPMLFAHGFGCDQNMWRYVAPAFEDDFRVVLFDNRDVGRSTRLREDATAGDALALGIAAGLEGWSTIAALAEAQTTVVRR